MDDDLAIVAMGSLNGWKIIEWRPSVGRVKRHGRSQKNRLRGAEKSWSTSLTYLDVDT